MPKYSKRILLVISGPEEKSIIPSTQELIKKYQKKHLDAHIIYLDKDKDFDQKGQLIDPSNPKFLPLTTINNHSKIKIVGHGMAGSDNLESDEVYKEKSDPKKIARKFSTEEIANVIRLSCSETIREVNDSKDHCYLHISLHVCEGCLETEAKQSFAMSLARTLNYADDSIYSTISATDKNIIYVKGKKLFEKDADTPTSSGGEIFYIAKKMLFGSSQEESNKKHKKIIEPKLSKAGGAKLVVTPSEEYFARKKK